MSDRLVVTTDRCMQVLLLPEKVQRTHPTPNIHQTFYETSIDTHLIVTWLMAAQKFAPLQTTKCGEKGAEIGVLTSYIVSSFCSLFFLMFRPRCKTIA